jgi:hypothetical protein
MLVPMRFEVDSTSGASAVTDERLGDAAIDSVSGTVSSSPTRTTMLLRTIGWKPESSALTVYGPGSSCGIT